MRRSSSKVTGKKTPQSRNQLGISLMNADNTGLIANHTDPPGLVGFTPGMRAVWLRCCTCFLTGIWPLLSTSRWNFLWTLLYLNSPVNSEGIAGRLLCNSATKCREMERWFSHVIPEKRIYLAGSGMTSGGLDFFVFSLSGMKGTWLQAYLIIICIPWQE